MKRRSRQRRQKSELRTIDSAAQARVKGGWSSGAEAPNDIATGQASGAQYVQDKKGWDDSWR
jgi:hypothetical protein